MLAMSDIPTDSTAPATAPAPALATGGTTVRIPGQPAPTAPDSFEIAMQSWLKDWGNKIEEKVAPLDDRFSRVLDTCVSLGRRIEHLESTQYRAGAFTLPPMLADPMCWTHPESIRPSR